MIPSTQLTADEIRAFWDQGERVLAKWGTVQTAVHPDEFSAYRQEVAEALSGIEKIEDMIETEIGDWKRKLGTVKLMKRDLDRHEELSKGKFWSAKRALESAR